MVACPQKTSGGLAQHVLFAGIKSIRNHHPTIICLSSWPNRTLGLLLDEQRSTINALIPIRLAAIPAPAEPRPQRS